MATTRTRTVVPPVDAPASPAFVAPTPAERLGAGESLIVPPESETKPDTKPDAKEAATFDWDALEESSVVEYTYAKVHSSVDWEKDTPEAIKSRVKASFAAYQEAEAEETKRITDANGGEVPTEGQKKRIAEAAGKACARKQKFGSLAQAEEFFRLARGYATHCGYTLRAKLDAELFQKEGQSVTYRVRPKESRPRSR